MKRGYCLIIKIINLDYYNFDYYINLVEFQISDRCLPAECNNSSKQHCFSTLVVERTAQGQSTNTSRSVAMVTREILVFLTALLPLFNYRRGKRSIMGAMKNELHSGGSDMDTRRCRKTKIRFDSLFKLGMPIMAALLGVYIQIQDLSCSEFPIIQSNNIIVLDRCLPAEENYSSKQHCFSTLVVERTAQGQSTNTSRSVAISI